MENLNIPFFYGEYMVHIAKVTSKRMITIPAKIMRKYNIKEGMRIKFVEREDGILMIPVPDFEDLWGIDRKYASAIVSAIRELEVEHRKEAVL